MEKVTSIPVSEAPKYDKLRDLEMQLDALGEMFVEQSVGKLEYIRTQVILEQTKILQSIDNTLGYGKAGV